MSGDDLNNWKDAVSVVLGNQDGYPLMKRESSSDQVARLFRRRAEILKRLEELELAILAGVEDVSEIDNKTAKVTGVRCLPDDAIPITVTSFTQGGYEVEIKAEYRRTIQIRSLPDDLEAVRSAYRANAPVILVFKVSYTGGHTSQNYVGRPCSITGYQQTSFSPIITIDLLCRADQFYSTTSDDIEFILNAEEHYGKATMLLKKGLP